MPRPTAKRCSIWPNGWPRKGFAYEKLRSLYFDISRFEDYGRLSGIDLDKIRLGATVDLDDYEKDNPRDFTLLKRARLAELKRGTFVKTEWGQRAAELAPAVRRHGPQVPR